MSEEAHNDEMEIFEFMFHGADNSDGDYVKEGE